MTRPPRIAFLALVAGAAVALPAAAFVCTTPKMASFVSIHWETRKIPWAIQAPGSLTLNATTARQLITASFTAWSEPRCTDLVFDAKGVVMPGTPLDEVPQVRFVHQNWQQEGEVSRDSSAIALTTMTFEKATGIIHTGIIEVNESDPMAPRADGFVFADAELSCPEDSAMDLGAVLTHEVGHFIGLAHTDQTLDSQGRPLPIERQPTMTAAVQPCKKEFRTLEVDDIDGLCTIYPSGRGARQCGRLPVQEVPYVESKPFGCSAQRGLAPWWWFAILVLTCSSHRSRR
ncbi:MAG: matrixin family metalloprotease [Myxococcota bacterium]